MEQIITIYRGGITNDDPRIPGSELSRKANVNIRSIQMYEQRNKDINKASVETVYHMAKVLGCSIEDLLEK